MLAGASIHAPAALPRWVEELPRGRPIVVYCICGFQVSGTAVNELRQRGYDARALVGGITAWHAIGGMTVPLDTATAVVVLVIGQDFCYYWLHRASHRIRWFWATHAVHHSSNELNLGASYRFGWTGRLTGAAIFYVPMIWLGFAPGPVFIAAAFGLLYQFWVHTEWIPKLGWLEYVLNTPSHHRVHHAANPEYLDRNYGGIFIVFDRLFGTFVSERDDVPCRYGLVTPLRSNNPLVIGFHEWAAMARDLWQARTWRERLMHVVGPPGWRADVADAASEVHASPAMREGEAAARSA